jgi:ribulose-5-phosphate 4-epimerase/fuculose-1-phosphate aldolase
MNDVAPFRRPAIIEPQNEWQARVDLAAAYRLVAHFGLDDLVHTHISLRVPGEAGHFLINPYGLMFAEITASSLVKIDCDGKVVGDAGDSLVNEAGFVIHSAIHMARHDVGCVLHTHTRAGIAVSCLEEGLLPLNQFALQFHNRVGYHAYEGIALDLDERQRLVRDLGAHDALILRNHGLLTCGRTAAEAFVSMYYLEQSCRMQIDLLPARERLVLPDGQVAEKTARQYEAGGPGAMGQREWPALLRLLDRVSPGYAC